MKDLKHIHYFTELLDNPNNELVRQAKEDGYKVFGYTCYFVPEVLMNFDKSVGLLLRAPNSGGTEIATYYLSNFLCGYSKAVLERAIEGGYNYLDGIIATETCSQMNRALEHFELLKTNGEDFLLPFLDAPVKISKHGIKVYASQYRRKVLEPMKERFGIDISDEAIKKGVEEHNELNRILFEISELRKEENPKITGTEFHIIHLVARTCPKYLVMDKLKETLAELKKRKVDAKPNYKVKVVVAGSEIDDYKITEMIEDCGALVVADRYCFGSLPSMEQIVVADDEDIVEAIMKHYMVTSQCPRYMDKDKVEGRREYINDLVKEFNADGVILESLKFCEYWSYENPLSAEILREEYNVPNVTFDRNYTASASGQMRTRVQAFVESLEIKKINNK